MFILVCIQGRNPIVVNTLGVVRLLVIQVVWLGIDGRTLGSDPINVKTPAVKRLLLDERH